MRREYQGIHLTGCEHGIEESWQEKVIVKNRELYSKIGGHCDIKLTNQNNNKNKLLKVEKVCYLINLMRGTWVWKKWRFFIISVVADTTRTLWGEPYKKLLKLSKPNLVGWYAFLSEIQHWGYTIFECVMQTYLLGP